jgi:hypothetical protein
MIKKIFTFLKITVPCENGGHRFKRRNLLGWIILILCAIIIGLYEFCINVYKNIKDTI